MENTFFVTEQSSEGGYTPPTIITLSNGTVLTVSKIDLFDENRFGANKLFIVKSCTSIADIAAQIKFVLNNFYPLIKEGTESDASSITVGDTTYPSALWVNRLDAGHHHWTQIDGEPFPNRARYAIRFLLRIQEYDGFGYLEIGKRWGDLALTDDTQYRGIKYNEHIDPAEIQVLKYTCLSKETAFALTHDIVAAMGVNDDDILLQDADGNLISL